MKKVRYFSLKLMMVCILVISMIGGAFTFQVNGAQALTVQDWTVSPATATVLYTNTVYRVNENLTIGSTNSGRNGLVVASGATTTIYIPQGKTLTVYGGNGNGRNPGYAGIYLPNNATLIITGGGRLNVFGGKGGDGVMGQHGDNPYDNTSNFYMNANGPSGDNHGIGGNGGGGAGAAIGGNGGSGGSGGSMSNSGQLYTMTIGYKRNGITGNSGISGAGGSNMGSLYVLGNVTVNGSGGSQGSTPNSKNSGGNNHIASTNSYAAAAGGGAGGNGGYGSATTLPIGGGAPGGGGGGSGGTGGVGYSSSLPHRSESGSGGSGGAPYGLGGGMGASTTNWGSNGNDATISSGGALSGASWANNSAYAGGTGGQGGNRGSYGGNGLLYSSQTAVAQRNRDYAVTTHNDIQYKVTFDNSEATIAGTSSTMATLGVTMPTITIPKRNGYKFNGFYAGVNGTGTKYYNEDGSSAYEWDKVAANTTLYPAWSRTAFQYNIPDINTKEGVSATISYQPANEADYGSQVVATVTLSGTASKSGMHIATLTSPTLGSSFKVTVAEQVSKGSIASKNQTSTFIVPAQDITDMTLTHEYIVMPDLYNQTYNYDGENKSYTIDTAFNKIKVGRLKYEKTGSSEGAVYTLPKDVGEYTVTIPLTIDGSSTIVNLTKQLTIVPKLLEWDVSQLRPNDKEYDGTNSATITGNIKVKGILPADNVALGNAAITKGSYDSPMAERNKVITVDTSKVTLVGASKGNYALSTVQPTLRANINGIEAKIIIKNPNPTNIYSGNIEAVSDLVDFADPNVNSVILDGPNEENLSYVYYTNAACTAMTTATNGAQKDGGAPSHAGNYWIKVSYFPSQGQAQYSSTISSSIPYIISQKNITPTVEWLANQDGFIDDAGILSHEYTGAIITPKVEVYADITKTIKLVEDVDYIVTYQDNINVGSGAQALITLKKNYVGNANKAFSINKATYDMSPVHMSNQEVTYDKRNHPVGVDDIYALLKIDTKLIVDYTYLGIDGTSYPQSSNAPVETGKYQVKATITTQSSNWKFPGDNEDQYSLTSTLTILDTYKLISFNLNGGNISGNTDTVTWNNAPQYKLMKDYPGGVPQPTYDGYILSGWESDGILYSGQKIDDEEIQRDREYKAIWTETNVKVNFDANGGVFNDLASIKSYEQAYGSQLEFSKIAVPTKEHLNFIGWGESPTDTTPLSGNFDFTDLSAIGKTYYALYQTDTYNLTLHYNGGMDSQNKEYMTLTIPYEKTLKEAYPDLVLEEPVISESTVFGFIGWIDANDTVKAPLQLSDLYDLKLDKDMVYIAKWSGDTISIDYSNYNAGLGMVAYSLPKLTAGAKPASPEPLNPIGKEFKHWQVTSSGQSGINIGSTYSQDDLFNLAVKESVSFSAIFEANQYQVHFDLNNGTLNTGSIDQQITHDSSPTPVTAKKEGYVLNQWLNLTTGVYIDTDQLTSQVIEDNTVYVAQWKEDLKAISFDANGGLDTRNMSIKNGGKVDVETIIHPSKENFSFVGWASSLDKANKGQADITGQQTITADTTYYAVWSNVTQNVLFRDENGNKIEEKRILKNTTIDRYFTSEPVSSQVAGSEFKGWKKETDLTLLKWNDIKALNVTSDMVFTAVFEKNKYTLNFDTNGGSDGPSAAQEDFGKVVLLGEYKIPTAPKGYAFTGWFDQPIGGNPISQYTFETNKTIYAQYSADSALYNIEYYEKDLDGQTYTLAKTDEVQGATATLVNLVAPERVGFHLEADKTQYLDSTMSASATPLPVNGDGSLVIRLYYERNLYSLEYVTQGKEDVIIPEGYNKDYLYGETIEIQPYLQADGYGFEGWYSNGITIINKQFKMPAGNVQLLGKFNPNQYMVRYEIESDTGSSIVDNTKYKLGEEVKLPTTPPIKSGYSFIRWYSDEVDLKSRASYFEMPAKDIVVKAEWVQDIYEMSFDSNGGNPIESINSPLNATITLPQAPSKVSGHFIGWELDQAIYVAGAQYTVVEGAKQFKALWQNDEYTITYVLNDGLFDRDVLSTYQTGQDITLTKPSRAGYTFTGWYEDEALSQLKNEITNGDERNITVYAGWMQSEWFLTYELNGGAFSELPKLDYQKDDEFMFVQPQKEGNHFIGWYTDIDLTEEKSMINTEDSGNFTLYAKWEAIPVIDEMYQVSFHLDDGNTYLNASYPKGQSNLLIPASKSGYSFAGWYLEPDYQTVVTALDGSTDEVKLYAKWESVTEQPSTPPIVQSPTGSQVINNPTSIEAPITAPIEEKEISQQDLVPTPEKVSEDKQMTPVNETAQTQATQGGIAWWWLIVVVVMVELCHFGYSKFKKHL